MWGGEDNIFTFLFLLFDIYLVIQRDPKELERLLTLSRKLFLRGAHHLQAELVRGQVLDDVVLTTRARDRERVHEPSADAVLRAVAEDAHRHDLAGGRPEEPVADVVAGGGGGGRGRALLAGLDNLGATLLDGGDEGLLDPLGVGDEAVHRGGHPLLGVVAHVGEAEVGVLRGGVVAPDDHVVDALHLDPDPLSDLSLGSVVVKSGHACDVALGLKKGRRNEKGKNIEKIIMCVYVGKICYEFSKV